MEDTTKEKLNEYFKNSIDAVININNKVLSAKQYTNVIEEYANDKYEELYEAGIAVLPENGIQTITFETIPYNHSYNTAFAYQVVYKKHDQIVKYGDFYINGYVAPSLMATSDSGCIQRVPLPQEVEFDRLWLCGNAIYARPKKGQTDLDDIEGSLDNYLYIMGDNTYGALGLGDTRHRLLPEKKEFESRVVQVINQECANIMQNDAYILLENKALYGAGHNQFGQHGHGHTTQINTWTKVSDNVDYFYCSDGSNFMVKEGNLYVSGYNDRGQLGKGDATNSSVFVQIFKNIKDITINECQWWASDWSLHKANTVFKINDQFYVCGVNNHWQLNCLSTSDIKTIERVRDDNNQEVEFPKGCEFSNTIDTSFYLIPNDEGNTDFFMAGNGTSGKGDGTVGSATKFSKKYTFKGLGWKIYSAYNMWNAYQEVCYVYNLNTKEIWSMGHNVDNQLGVGTTTSNEPKFKKVILPNTDKIRQFEILFMINKTLDLHGGLALIINNRLYCTGAPIKGNKDRSSSIPTQIFHLGDK